MWVLCRLFWLISVVNLLQGLRASPVFGSWTISRNTAGASRVLVGRCTTLEQGDGRGTDVPVPLCQHLQCRSCLSCCVHCTLQRKGLRGPTNHSIWAWRSGMMAWEQDICTHQESRKENTGSDWRKFHMPYSVAGPSLAPEQPGYLYFLVRRRRSTLQIA